MSAESAVRLIQARINHGYMPNNLGQLLERRGTIEEAAMDVAGFAGMRYEHCLAALQEVYRS